MVAMGVLSVSDPLKHLAAGEPSESHEPNNLPNEFHKGEQKSFVCACRPRFPIGGITFLSEHKGG